MKLKGRVINRGSAEGSALVFPKPISLLGDIDRKTGVIKNRMNPLYGNNVASKIIFSARSIGSTVGAWVLYVLKKRGLAPAAIILEEADTVIASGCIISNIPLIDKVNFWGKVLTGDHVKVFEDGTIIVESERVK